MARGEPVSTGAGSCGGVVGWVVWWGHQRLMGCGGVVWVAMVCGGVRWCGVINVYGGVVVWGRGVVAWCGLVLDRVLGGAGGAGGRRGARGGVRSPFPARVVRTPCEKSHRFV